MEFENNIRELEPQDYVDAFHRFEQIWKDLWRETYPYYSGKPGELRRSMQVWTRGIAMRKINSKRISQSVHSNPACKQLQDIVPAPDPNDPLPVAGGGKGGSKRFSFWAGSSNSFTGGKDAGKGGGKGSGLVVLPKAKSPAAATSAKNMRLKMRAGSIRPPSPGTTGIAMSSLASHSNKPSAIGLAGRGVSTKAIGRDGQMKDGMLELTGVDIHGLKKIIATQDAQVLEWMKDQLGEDEPIAHVEFLPGKCFEQILRTLEAPLGMRKNERSRRGKRMRFMRFLELPLDNATGCMHYKQVLKQLVDHCLGGEMSPEMTEIIEKKMQVGKDQIMESCDFTVSELFAARIIARRYHAVQRGKLDRMVVEKKADQLRKDRRLALRDRAKRILKTQGAANGVKVGGGNGGDGGGRLQ